MNPALHILGGGPAGLAAAHYARKRGLDFTLYEAGSETGGNCRTLRLGDCLFDTGAHRLHARIPESTAEFRSLLGDELLEVDAPSEIALQRGSLRFPPSPRDLIRKLDPGTLGRVAWELLRRKSQGPSGFRDFREMAEARYGKTLAEMFLLNYTRKLWGRDPAELSVRVGGGRLDGLDLKSMLWEKLRLRPPSAHLEGRFLYPKLGIGSLFQALSGKLDPVSIRLQSAITRFHHDGRRILGVTLNGGEECDTPSVISTLPLPLFLRALYPAPPREVLEIAEGIVFRQLLLCVLVLDMERFTSNASIYVPNPDVPFTRIYEPKNRSAFMAPAGKTCLVLEIPCDGEDGLWKADGLDPLSMRPHLRNIRPLTDDKVLECALYRIPNAYPVLERGIESKVEALLQYCGGFSNLTLLGRNALFRYTHIHDIFAQAAKTILCY